MLIIWRGRRQFPPVCPKSKLPLGRRNRKPAAGRMFVGPIPGRIRIMQIVAWMRAAKVINRDSADVMMNGVFAQPLEVLAPVIIGVDRDFPAIAGAAAQP